MSNIVGIDLGTTFSCLAVLEDNGRPTVIPNSEGERITPSALFFEGEKTVLVGREAINLRQTDLSRSVRWIKRYMGEAQYPQDVLGRKWTPAELSAFIIRKLKDDCAQQVGPIENAVITVPSYFDEVCRKATMDAGEMAGLNVIAIINEPTAAALHYAVSGEVNGRILVFDLGGGTFDVTIMDVSGRNVQILASDGDHELGGHDFDMKIVERMSEMYKEEHGAEERDESQKAGWESIAEDMKKSLSQRPHAQQPFLGSDGRVVVKIQREEYEEMISSYMAKIDMLLENVLDEAKCEAKEIDKVLLVGGSSRTPVVQQRIEKFFGFPPVKEVNVDECVALGAAIHAGIIMLEENPEKVNPGIAQALQNITATDVANHFYGTICIDLDDQTGRPEQKHDILIKRGTSLPCEVSKVYNTAVHGQEVIRATVTQSPMETDDPDMVNKLAEELMDLPPDRPAGRPVKVTYGYDKNQRMRCVFEDVESGRSKVFDDVLSSNSDTSQSAPLKKAALDAFIVE